MVIGSYESVFDKQSICADYFKDGISLNRKFEGRFES